MPAKPAKRTRKPRHRRPFVTWQGADDKLAIAPALTLRIFAEDNPRKHFVEVYLWHFVYHLRGIRKQAPGSRTTRAFFTPMDQVRQTPDARGRKVASRKIGELHFCRKFTTYETVAHECYHATRYWSHRQGHSEASNKAEYDAEPISINMPEEKNARFHGMLTDRVIAAFLRFFYAPKTRSVQICTDRETRPAKAPAKQRARRLARAPAK